jgi:hypothetical protein
MLLGDALAALGPNVKADVTPGDEVDGIARAVCGVSRPAKRIKSNFTLVVTARIRCVGWVTPHVAIRLSGLTVERVPREELRPAGARVMDPTADQRSRVIVGMAEGRAPRRVFVAQGRVPAAASTSDFDRVHAQSVAGSATPCRHSETG